MDENKEFRPEATVEILDSGPLRITGNFILKDIKRGDESAPGEVLLCRCGKSGSMPFCDDSHKHK